MNRGDATETVQSYWDKQGFSFDAVVEEEVGANAEAMGVIGYPTNIIVGPDGKVLFAGVGFEEDVVRELLGLAE